MMRNARTRWSLSMLALLASLVLLGPAAAVGQEDDGVTPPAEEEEDTSRAGPYVGLGVAGGIANFDGGKLFTITTPSQGNIQEEASVGINARVGWRFLSWAAAEVHYEWMNDFTVETRGEACAKVKAQVLTGNVKLYAPHHSFHPYALAGVGAARYERETRTIAIGAQSCSPNPGKHSSLRDWDFAARLGLGFDLYLTQNIVVNLETTGVYSDEQPLDTAWPFVSITAGIQYRF